MRIILISAVLTVLGVSIEHVNGTLETIALVGAAVAAIGVVHVKVFKPLANLVRVINRGVDAALHIEEWTKKVDQRLDRLEDLSGAERLAAETERRAARGARASA